MELFFKIKDRYLKIEKYVMPVALISGFLWDNFTLRRIDLWVENLAFLSYLTLAFLGMSFLNAYEEGKFRGKAGILGRELSPFLLQFTFGGLFSAFLIFYSRSASLFTSWPLLLLFLWLMVGNEFYREKYLRMVFHLSVFFVALFSYVIFALPIVWGEMGPLVFFTSGLISLLLIGTVSFLFYYISPRRMIAGKTALLKSVLVIYLLFNLLYFTNLIPPVPLSLKDGGVFHSVERIDADNYEVTYEPAPGYMFWREDSPSISITAGEPVYVFSAVFAPTKINTVIYHEWSYFNEEGGRWEEISRISFPISGGRDGGFRGYTQKSSLDPGRWRVLVENERGQTLGRINFQVIHVDQKPQLVTGIR